MAWHKGAVGHEVQWIGANLRAESEAVVVSIPADKLEALRKQTIEFLKNPVATKRSVRSFCGKVAFVAGMVPTIRPFLRMLWGAVSSTGAARLPASMLHCKQMGPALHWLLAFFKGLHGPLVRSFPLAVAMADEGNYVATDACPWGFAGVLFKHHQPIAWYAEPLSEDDLRRFRAKRGDSGHNTT